MGRLTQCDKALQPSGLIDRLARHTGLPRLDVKEALARLALEGKISGVSKTGEPLKKVQWIGIRPEMSSTAQQLLCAFERLTEEIPEALLRRLLSCSDLFDGLSTEDIEHVLRGLLHCQSAGPYQDAVLASAKHILGSAKALNNLKRPARALDLDRTEDTAGELYVLTAGPPVPKAIVLIENIRSFTAFARSAHAQNATGVAAYGYGLTMENFGSRLAAEQVIACPAYGAVVNLRHALEQLPVLFWGDLDQEGLRIYESLRRQLPHVCLSGAYSAMEARLKSNTLCHPYHRLFEKAGQRQPKGDIPAIAYLAERCRSRAVDQEALGMALNDIDVTGVYIAPHQQGEPG